MGNNELIEKIVLKVARTGTDKINFKILEMIDNGGGIYFKIIACVDHLGNQVVTFLLVPK